MAVANKPNALERVASDPVSRRKLLAVTGGSTALAAFLAACGSDDSETTTMATNGGAGKTGTEQFGKGDVGILNYALTLEYLESSFYREAKTRAKASGDLRALIDLVAKDEEEHVEDTGVSAYNGAGPRSSRRKCWKRRARSSRSRRATRRRSGCRTATNRRPSPSIRR